MKINEDYGALLMFGEHVCRILDTNMEKQMN